MDLFKQHAAKRLKRVSSPSSADNFISSALSSSLSGEDGGNKDPKDTMLTSDQKSRMEFNKSLAKAKMNLKLCSDKISKLNANGDSVRYVKLEELLVEETWLEVLPGEFQKPYAKNLCRFVEKDLILNQIQLLFPIRITPTQNKAIGVPEFDSYFRAELSNSVDVETREMLLKEAINEVKINNCILASQQLEKIKRLINVKGWKIQRLDVTEVFRRKQRNAEEEAEEIWKNMVMGQSIKIMGKFLCENNRSKMVYRNDVTAIKRAAVSAIAQYYFSVTNS
ncbi:PREDICTED: adenylate isopentenyltransferase 6, chloroplastic-like [Nicotiana attenuata]|uniref:adenylate isopentenyltransferase 6, chloroplastic-like n=1 Tax=Nicotiana attenuata TaxID=49451 RepID=UPI0009047F2D|nr:PREDICTED: adenylate isopentenyltransferase 6, chloroplastic-like [Nicotiana attenuata]